MTLIKFAQLVFIILILCWLDCPTANAKLHAYNSIAKANIVPFEHIDKLVKSWLNHPALKNSQVGLEIIALPSGQKLASVNGNTRFVPASVAKILTCACALETFGNDFKFSTKLLSLGPIKKDKLKGDLILATSQDPSLNSADIQEMIEALHKQGIKTVEGNLKLLTLPGASDYFCPSWLAEDWSQDWMPVSSNLVLDGNLAPAKDPGRGIHVQQPSPVYYELALLQSLLKSNLSPGWVLYDPVSHSVQVCRAASPSLSHVGVLTIANPDSYNLELISHLFKIMGITVSGHLVDQHENKEAEIITEHLSRSLTQIIKFTLRESDNLYAQQLLRSLGVKSRELFGGQVLPLEESGLNFLRDWLVRLGVPQQEIVLFDGCGLSRKNCISPHALNIVLKHMAGEKVDGTFLNLLRVQGPSKSTAGSFEFKTGTMDSIRSVTGVIRTKGNDTLAVSILVNAHTPIVSDLKSAINSLITELEALPTLGKDKLQIKPSTITNTKVTRQHPEQKSNKPKNQKLPVRKVKQARYTH